MCFYRHFPTNAYAQILPVRPTMLEEGEGLQRSEWCSSIRVTVWWMLSMGRGQRTSAGTVAETHQQWDQLPDDSMLFFSFKILSDQEMSDSCSYIISINLDKSQHYCSFPNLLNRHDTFFVCDLFYQKKSSATIRFIFVSEKGERVMASMSWVFV